METTFFELIKYDENASIGDFNGPEAHLSLEGQIDYLQRFSTHYAKHNAFDGAKKAATLEESRLFVDKIPYPTNLYRERSQIQDAEFFLADKRQYKHLFLYTNKAKTEGDHICLQASDAPPAPAFDIETEKSIKSAKILFTMGEDYYTPLRGKIQTMSTGKTIEFRKGIEEVIKFQLYPGGDLYVRLNYPAKYHHQNILLGQYRFGAANELCVRIEDDCFYAQLNGEEEKRFKLVDKPYPDTLFVGGGLHPRGTWTVKPIVYTDDGECVDVFAACDDRKPEEALGKKKLPFCVGSYSNRRKTLVLKKNFHYIADGKKVHLNISTVDPCGKATLNGQILFDDCSFLAKKIDVTEYLTEGENELIIEIEPRAPENVVTWHRHRDPYFGWFIGKIYLEKTDDIYIERVKIETLRTSPKIVFDGIVTLSSKTEEKTWTEIYVQDGEKAIKVGEGTGRISCSFDGIVWDTENPKLYTLTFKLYKEGKLIDEYVEITGFRTICQKEGKILLNDKDFVLKGALIMQYLPPYEEVMLNHVCPSDEQIIWQALLAKRMGCNCIRMHHLGYGTNDERFARIFDYFGITLIWTTRLIDDVYTVVWDGMWQAKRHYQSQMNEVINSPSIIMWEGANEVYLLRKDIDNIYREFVRGVKAVDTTRLLTPVSHFYYANDSYDLGCEYYQDDGKQDEYFRPVNAVEEWNDELVVRGAHTYIWMMGYGTDWSRMRKQSWSAQPNMLNSKKHAYIVSEYAVIGRQNPETEGAKLFYNPNSYEHNDEYVLGYRFDEDWRLSQAYQALCAKYSTKKMLEEGADGFLWCCLQSGANDGSYLKPPIDFHGYPKLAFYALKECFASMLCFDSGTDIVWGKGKKLRPVIISDADGSLCDVEIIVTDEQDNPLYNFLYERVKRSQRKVYLPEQELALEQGKYYKILYKIKDRCKSSK